MLTRRNPGVCSLSPAQKALFLTLTLAAVWLCLPAQAARAACGDTDPRTVLCVDADATGSATGLTWTDAFTNVQDALAVANADGATGYEIWVAEGIYYPDVGTGIIADSPTMSFTLRYNNVQLYGGFAGNETTREARDWTANLTVLSGDITQDDADPDGDGVIITATHIITPNANHVLWLDGVTNEVITGTTVIDGFTITAGDTDGSLEDDDGGGLYCDGHEANHACSPTLAHLTFSGNRAAGSGGGVYNNGTSGMSAPVLAYVTFSGNQANSGGGMYNASLDGSSSPTLTNVIFSGNYATTRGGGMLNDGGFGSSDPVLTNVLFEGNYAAIDGGGLYNQGSFGNSSPALTNVLFKGNYANDGGGMLNNASYGNSNPTLTNVTFGGNYAATSGGGMLNNGNSGTSTPTLVNCILWGNLAGTNGSQIYNLNGATTTITYSDVQGGDTSGNNINQDPLFVAPITATLAPTTTGNYRLQMGSRAFDNGNNEAPGLAGILTDLDNHDRFKDMPGPDGGNGDAPVVDMGAYEAPMTLLVDGDATGSANGLSWTDAFTNVQDALAVTEVYTTAPCEIWVAEGVYYPDEGAGQTNDDETASFTLRYDNVSLYGGFAGNESLRTARDRQANLTVLSGDITQNDIDPDGDGVVITTTHIITPNADHVLWLDGATHGTISNDTVIDGFTITAGDADSSAAEDDGGGLYCNGEGSGNGCSPTLQHLIFTGNRANYNGGGMANNGTSGGASTPELYNVTFRANESHMGWGGGMCNLGDQGSSSPALINLTFDSNRAYAGGGLYNHSGMDGYSSPELVNVAFIDNYAEVGGGMVNRGYDGISSPSLTNVTFGGNHAIIEGGAMVNLGSGASYGVSAPDLVNVILWGNSAPTGAQLYNDNATPTLNYTLIQSGTNDIYNTGATTVTYGVGILTGDPLFVDPASGNYRLGTGSPALDAGDNSAVDVDTDLDGNPRILGGTVDLGPYEALTANVYTLTLAVQGNGSTTPPTGNHVYEENTVVPITATADSGWEFAGWLGDVATPSAAATTVTMDAGKTVTATFSIKDAICVYLPLALRDSGN